jgi:hypothetical protein
VQHLEWTLHGRKYHHQDEGKPNTFTLTTKIGEVNVDVTGDGSSFAPYVLSGASLRHGDSECVFSDGWQEIKRLGQTLVSKSRLYVQRDIAGTWKDVPHGVPTRNVSHDYPSEGRCTAYLDFPDIQGYAAGARLQVGVEVGGGDRQVYGFRFRSPVAGTFRLEWVLEIPEDVDLAWITEPVDRHDPGQGTIRVGGRIGQTEIRWSRSEAPFRNATVETVAGGRILHLILGPYTVAAQEWVTIYPDTVTGSGSGADDWQNSGGERAFPARASSLWYGAWANDYEWAGIRFALSGAIPIGATIDSGTLTLRGAGDTAAGNTTWYVVASSDAPQITTDAARPAWNSGSTATLPNTRLGTGVVQHTGWNASTDNAIAVGGLVALLMTDYTSLASGAHVHFVGTQNTTTPGSVENSFTAYEGTPDPALSITYTAGGATLKRFLSILGTGT